MALVLRADDMFPGGEYCGMTVREVYEIDPDYFEKVRGEFWRYIFNERTIEILEKNLRVEDKSRPSFSRGGCLGRQEIVSTSIIKSGPYAGKTLEYAFMENESVYRLLLSKNNLFISESTYEELMTKKYGPDAVHHDTREELLANLPNSINGFSFSEEDEFIVDDDEEYLGQKTVRNTFSDQMQQCIISDAASDRYGLNQSIQEVFGPGAQYREGQKDAILAVLNGKRTLVVQHTGWGKSLVYFMSIKKLREMGRGPAIIISPLLALMHNQIQSTGKYKLKVKSIASDNKYEWREIYEGILDDSIDAIIISPERLADDGFSEFIKPYYGRISLFVVDEAHCISDWGHDFRPDFRRIIKVIEQLPKSTPVLATTATANDRVVRDIKKQLGEDLEITRGSMERESIHLEVVRLGSNDEKKRWLLENIKKFSGVGIIYCLTIRACEEIVVFLRGYGIDAEIYHGKLNPKDKADIEQEFQANEIKVLVATVAFGMGIDKPDIQFVIHYHQPGNAISYYQQIGRAGRSGNPAYTILLAGDDDIAINSYFIKNAFPTENQMRIIVNIISLNPGITKCEIVKQVEGLDDYMTEEWVEKVLKYLDVNEDIVKKRNRYYKTPGEWKCDMKRARMVSKCRWMELRQFARYVDTKECLMSFLREELNDKEITPCGHCANCLGHSII